MLELLLCFGAGMAASTWLRRRSERRSRGNQRREFSNLREPFAGQSSKLSSAQCAAVLFMTLPPENSAQLFNQLGPEHVQSITLEISGLPSISKELQLTVIETFCRSLGIPGDRDSFELAVRTEPELVAKAIVLLLER